MNYNSWNDLLLRFYFNNKYDHEIFLAIDKDSLVDFAFDSGLFEQSYSKLVHSSNGYNLDIRTYIWKDFIHLFYLKPTQNKQDILNFIQLKFKESLKVQCPLFFPCLGLFLIPLANNPEMDPRNFYRRINNFLHANYLILPNENIVSTDLAAFNRPSLSDVWRFLSQWTERNNYPYRVKFQTESYHRFVGPFMAESLLTSSQREKFKILFYKAGLSPDMELSKARKCNILDGYHKLLGFIDDNAWTRIFNTYKDILLSEFTRQYSKWDGQTIIKVHENNRRISQDYGVNKKLYLSLDFFRGCPLFGIIAIFKDSEIGTEYDYECADNREISCHCVVGYDGYSKPVFQNDTTMSEILKEYVRNGKPMVLNSISNKSHLLFQLEDFYLFEKYMSTYISGATLKLGGFFLILIKKEIVVEFASWLDENFAEEISASSIFSNTYILYRIKCVRSQLITRKALTISNKKALSLKNSFYLEKSSHNVVVYEDLPVYFEISGVNVTKDRIRAVFYYGTVTKSVDLNYCEETRLWKLERIKDSSSLKSQFKIFCNDELISTQVFSYGNFKILGEEEYQEISLDKWGNYTVNETDAITKGLALEGQQGIPYTFIAQMTGEVTPDFETSPYLNNDNILYWLSSRPMVDKLDFEDIVKIQMFKENLIEDGKTKLRISTLMENYYRLGYINYIYKDSKYVVSVNNPTLILLPPNYTIERIEGLSSETMKLKEKFWKCLLTGARTPSFIASLIQSLSEFSYGGKKLLLEIDPQQNPLYPQRILIWSPSINAITEFAKKSGIQFQPFLYASKLLDSIGGVSEYFSNTLIKYDDFSETYEGFSTYECLDYRKLQDMVEQDSSSVRKAKCFKQEFDKEQDVVKYFPGTYQERSILWYHGKQYPVDKFWGDFISMKLSGAKIITVDIDKGELYLPSFIKLPLIYARALTMLTGEAPESNSNKRIYQTCNNPVTQIQNLLKKLNQM